MGEKPASKPSDSVQALQGTLKGSAELAIGH